MRKHFRSNISLIFFVNLNLIAKCVSFLRKKDLFIIFFLNLKVVKKFMTRKKSVFFSSATNLMSIMRKIAVIREVERKKLRNILI